MVSTRLGVDAEAVRAQQQRSSDCMNEAILSGLKAAATALAVAGGSVAALQRGSEVNGAPGGLPGLLQCLTRPACTAAT